MKKQDQKQLAQDTIAELVSNQKSGDSIGEKLIVLLGFTDENFENPLTQELESQYDTVTGDEFET